MLAEYPEFEPSLEFETDATNYELGAEVSTTCFCFLFPGLFFRILPCSFYSPQKNLLFWRSDHQWLLLIDLIQDVSWAFVR